MKELCGCCEGLEKLTPLDISNRLGLNALSYRVGTHATFLETMMARLTTLYLDAEENPEVKRILHYLTTRRLDDPSIALLDAWAAVADVLTFYQERIANEGYLRTSTERRSILELARLVGYNLRPGVSASVFLAFDLEKGYDLLIEPGMRAQSLPGPGELPQSFETAEPLEARAVWNRLGVRMTRPQYIDSNNINQEYVFSWNEIPGDVTGSDIERLIEFLKKKYEINWINPANISKGGKIVQISNGGHTLSLKLNDTEVILIIDGKEIDKLIAKMENNVTKIYDGYRAINKVYLEGTALNLKPNDPLLFIFEEKTPRVLPVFRKVESIEAQSVEDRTIVTLQSPKAASGTKQEGQKGGGWMAADFVKDPASLLIKDLLKPPSLPPASPRKLERNVADAFATKSDIGTQMLLNLAPVLRSRYYPAWSSAKVHPTPSQLKSVEALRVKAAPFGHNAPLKPIYNDKYVPVGYEEWPLAGMMTIGIKLIWGYQLSVMAAAVTTLSTSAPYIQLSLEYKNENFGAELNTNIPWVNPISLGDINVTYKTEQKSHVFTFDKWLRKITVLVEESDAKITFGDNTNPDITLGFGQKQRISKGERRIRASYEYSTEAGLVVSVSDELLLKPDSAEQNMLFLDAQYDKILPESWIAIERPNSKVKIRKVTSTQMVSRTDYGITGTVTQLILNDDWLETEDKDLSAVRKITVYAQGDPLKLAEEAIDPEKRVNDVYEEQKIELDGLYDGLKSGRWLIVSGERTDVEDATGVKASELVMLANVTQNVGVIDEERLPLGSEEKSLPGDKVHTFLTLALEGLKYRYKRDTVNIYANVAKATHGETRNEVLGSGDGIKAFQEFQLRQSPLTYLAAATPAGAESTLKVRVNDVLWHETDSLAGLEPVDRKYITSTDDSGRTSVVFGNGLRGSRLPSGVENVRAVYRTGIGKPGNAKAEQISQLAAQPLGVKGVINPLPATGGVDREGRDQARRNAPLAVLALDRLVSVQDYADFARTYAGIGKARASKLPDKRRQIVFLTIAGAEDIPIDVNSDLYQNLISALHKYGDPHQQIRVELRELMLLVVSATVRVLPDYLWDKVEPRIRAAMLDTFSFERRELGQDVLSSEVVSIIQAVQGVDYVDLDIIAGIPEKKLELGVRRNLTPKEIADEVKNLLEKGAKVPPPRIVVNLEDEEEGVFRPAQIAYLTPDVPDTLILKEWKA
jgi:predicted phage baseplate assembly protein